MDPNKNNGKDTYLSYVIIIGLLIGTVVAVVTHRNIGVCAGVGMTWGIVVGMTIDYQKNKEKKD